jgi:hypothetical protein
VRVGVTLEVIVSSRVIAHLHSGGGNRQIFVPVNMKYYYGWRGSRTILYLLEEQANFVSVYNVDY